MSLVIMTGPGTRHSRVGICQPVECSRPLTAMRTEFCLSVSHPMVCMLLLALKTELSGNTKLHFVHI